MVGLADDKLARAYLLAAVRTQSVINDQLGETAFVLAYDIRLKAVTAYLSLVAGQTLTFAEEGPARIRDKETGTVWSLADGHALAGPLEGEQLRKLPVSLAFWFAWSDLHPKTELYMSTGGTEPATGEP